MAKSRFKAKSLEFCCSSFLPIRLHQHVLRGISSRSLCSFRRPSCAVCSANPIHMTGFKVCSTWIRWRTLSNVRVAGKSQHGSKRALLIFCEVEMRFRPETIHNLNPPISDIPPRP